MTHKDTDLPIYLFHEGNNCECDRLFSPVRTTVNKKQGWRFRVWAPSALSVLGAVKQRIYNNRPPGGLVQILTVTERQYTGIEYVVGSKEREIIDSDERLVVL